MSLVETKQVHKSNEKNAFYKVACSTKSTKGGLTTRCPTLYIKGPRLLFAEIKGVDESFGLRSKERGQEEIKKFAASFAAFTVPLS